VRVRDKIKEQSRLARMRLGNGVPDWVDIPSMEGIRVAMVPLVEEETQRSLVAASKIDVPDNHPGINAQNRVAMVWDVWQACRELDDIERKVWDSPEEMVAELEPSDIDYLFDQLTILMDYASPSLAKLSDQDVDDLKKAFGAIEWRELTGRQASALVMCISRLLPELLAAKFSSSGSTPNSTSRSENDESTLESVLPS